MTSTGMIYPIRHWLTPAWTSFVLFFSCTTSPYCISPHDQGLCPLYVLISNVCFWFNCLWLFQLTYITVHHNLQGMQCPYLACTLSSLSSLSQLCFCAWPFNHSLASIINFLAFLNFGHTHLWNYPCIQPPPPHLRAAALSHTVECCWIKIPETCWMDSHQVYERWSQIGSRPWGSATTFI